MPSPTFVKLFQPNLSGSVPHLSLQAVALDLKAVVIGAFHDHEVKQAASLPADEEPLYLIPVGR